MINMTLEQASQTLNAQLIGRNTTFKGIHNDTRQLRTGEL